MYNIATDQWTRVAQTLRCTSCSSALQLDETLYLFGGHSFQDESDHNYMQIFNLESLIWKERQFESNILYFACVLLNLPESFIKGRKIS